MQIESDLKSKLTDGLLAGGVLVLLNLLLIQLIRPVQLIFGRPGLLVFTVCLVAISVVCLEQCLSNRISDLVRSWWGIIGGMVAWVVIELGTWLGGQLFINVTAIINLLFFMLVFSILWRRVAPSGLRYYFLMILLGWVSHTILDGIIFLAGFQTMMSTVLNGVELLAVVAMLGSLAFMFLRTHKRQERLNAAIVVWCAAMILVFILRGGYI